MSMPHRCQCRICGRMMDDPFPPFVALDDPHLVEPAPSITLEEIVDNAAKIACSTAQREVK